MDQYDKHIKKCIETGSPSYRWVDGFGLFKMVGVDTSDVKSGCLTMIKGEPIIYKAVIKGEVDEALTQEIINDPRLPDNSDGITFDNLSVFAEWQRRIDILQNS